MTQISQRRIRIEIIDHLQSYHDKSHNFGKTLRIICEWKKKVTNYTINISWKSMF